MTTDVKTESAEYKLYHIAFNWVSIASTVIVAQDENEAWIMFLADNDYATWIDRAKVMIEEYDLTKGVKFHITE